MELRSILAWVDTPAYHSTRGPDRVLFSKFIEELIVARQGKGDSEISLKRLKRYMFLNESLQKEITNKLPTAAVWTGDNKFPPQVSEVIQDLKSAGTVPSVTSQAEETSNASEMVDSLPKIGNL